MEKLNTHIEEIKVLLVQVLSIISSLSDEKFDEQLNLAKIKMQEVRSIKKMLQKSYSYEELLPFEENLYNLAKQIEEKFDNTIKKKMLEKEKVAQSIGQLQNKKNLQKYRR